MRSKSASKRLTVSIISYNTKDLLRRNLKSIFKFTKGLTFEVIVVDNHSTDGSAAMVKKEFPLVRLISNKTNQWYTGANNQALKIAKGKYFLILNSDTYLTSNAFKILVGYLEKNPKVGAVEPRQEDEKGRVANTSSRHNSWWLDLIELTWLHKFLKPQALAKFRLSGVNRKNTYPAEVVSDGAMLIRTKLLQKIGGYDTGYKLYYTENDLCQKIQKLGYQTVHVGQAMIKHRISASTDKVGWRIISGVYAADARAYYKQYESVFIANLVYFSLKLNNFVIKYKQHWPWLSLVVLATVLRFYRLPELMTFIGDQGRDYLAARDMVLTGQWPLVGIPSSIPWLHQGVLFIWLTALMFKLGGFNPLMPAILTGVMGVVGVYLLYRLSRSWWAGLIMATAPLSVIHSRLPYHLSPLSFVAIGYLWALTINSVGWGIFFTALLLQFELSTLPLVFLLFFWFRKSWQRLLYWSPIGLIPFLPKIIYDFSHGFSQTAGLVAWTGYRLTRLGQYGNAGGNIFDYWTKFISPGYRWLAVAVGLWLVLTFRRQPRVLVLTTLFLFLGFYVHGSPSEGYFMVLFPAWAWALANLGRSKITKAILLILVIFNIFNLFKHDFYTYGPTIQERLWLVDTLPDRLKLTEFSGNPGWSAYLDNYRYLMWWRGKNYDDGTAPVYSIYDGDPAKFQPPPWATVYHFGNQKLIKYD
jgi:hypothetical protein